MARRVNEEGLNLIKQWEGLKLEAYRDPNGKLTIGYGHTNDSGNEPHVFKGLIITKGQAEEVLRKDLRACEAYVNKVVKVPLTDAQFSTLVSFCFNVGSKNLQKSTLLKKLNMGQHEAVPRELMKWTKCGGKPVIGLANRRAAEAGLWVKGSYVSSNYHPVDKSNLDMRFYTEVATPVVGGLSGLGGIASSSPPIQYALAFIMVAAACIGVYLLINKMKENSL